MANIGDILLKYKNEYPTYQKQANNRLKTLKRSFSNIKYTYKVKTDILNNQLQANQAHFFTQFDQHHAEYANKVNNIKNTFKEISDEFNEEISNELKFLDIKAEHEQDLYENILEEFEIRKQDAFDIYLKLTKDNNALIDKDMKVHVDFLNQEQSKLEKFRNHYEDLNAKLNNKLLWTIEKSKNSISQLENDLSQVEKNDIITLNKNIIQSLSEMRGERNDINAMFKETSSTLLHYKEEIYKIRKTKQKPYSDINQKLIQKLVKQIRIANDNKRKYQEIINRDLQDAKNKIHPLILKAEHDHNNDQLEKYILQVEALENKANFLNGKIEKITNYNISTYQKRIKEIKVEAFTRNEEIKYTYSVPMKFIENSINIYSNYNFYLNQGFNDLDQLLTKLIDFTQTFNDIRADEISSNKKDFSDYQNILFAKITQISEKLSELLFNIDEVAFKITTLESSYRLKIAKIKKEIINIDIKGDYLKFLESLNTDFELANSEYNSRLKRIYIEKLYKDKLHEIYKTSTDLNQEIQLVNTDQAYNEELIQLESEAHREIYHNLSSQLDHFYTYQTKLMQVFMNIMKEKITLTTKASNHRLANHYYHLKDDKSTRLIKEENVLVSFIKNMQNQVEENNKNAQIISKYLKDDTEKFSLEVYFQQAKEQLLSQINHIENKKTNLIKSKIHDAFLTKKTLLNSKNMFISVLLYFYKDLLIKLDSSRRLEVSDVFGKDDFMNSIHYLTISYYDSLNYLYKYSVNSKIHVLNNYYDDFIIDFTESYITYYDKCIQTKKQKNKRKVYTAYLIDSIEKLNNFSFKIDEINDLAFDSIIKKYAIQLAVVKINIDKHKSYLDFEYDNLAKKSNKLNSRVKSQVKLISKYTHDMNNFLTNRVISKNKKFLKKKKNSDQLLTMLKKEVSKIIHVNDKALSQLLKDIDASIVNDFSTMLNEYQTHKKIIVQEIEKIVFDAKVESQYNQHIMDQYQLNISNTRNQLLKQLEILPAERQSRLSSIEGNSQSFFNKEYSLLLKKYSKIERDKFRKAPILEEKIKYEEDHIFTEYEDLYNKHKLLEEDYLNQYVNFNNDISVHTDAFRKGKIQSSLSFDKDLTQPLFKLSNTQSSMIDKAIKIHHETSKKTQDKIEELHIEKVNSDRKQSRIINS